MALLLLLACPVLSLIALASAGTALMRFKRAGLPAAAVSLIGLVICWAAPIAVIGLAEGTFASRPLVPVILMLLGGLGFCAVIAGALMALRRAPENHPDLCQSCGYDLRGRKAAAPCPECGVAVTPEPGSAASQG